jgi:hypothetical protein
MVMGFSPPPTVLYSSPVSTLMSSSPPPLFVAPMAGAVVRASASAAPTTSRSRTTTAPQKKPSHVPFQVSSLATLGLSVATEEQALRQKVGPTRATTCINITASASRPSRVHMSHSLLITSGRVLRTGDFSGVGRAGSPLRRDRGGRQGRTVNLPVHAPPWHHHHILFESQQGERSN